MVKKALDVPVESDLQPEIVVEQRTVRGNVTCRLQLVAMFKYG